MSGSHRFVGAAHNLSGAPFGLVTGIEGRGGGFLRAGEKWTDHAD